jgi:hypothetical protein
MDASDRPFGPLSKGRNGLVTLHNRAGYLILLASQVR